MAVFTQGFRIYYAHTDAAGIVYHSRYLDFLEQTRTEWLRAHGLSQACLHREYGIVFLVRDTCVRFVLPARLDDWIEGSIERLECSRWSLAMTQCLFLGPQCLLRAQVKLVAVHSEDLRLCRVPQILQDKLLG